jgi:glyoxylase-like metal-dependent hydrolase (beta-lactamase superfamily II)
MLIQTGERTVLVDTGFGDKHVDFPGFGPFRGGELLNSFSRAEVDLADVDTVIYTHLHLDHVGWTSRVANGARMLTFPKARYLARCPDSL